MRTMQIGTGCGNEFVDRMSGDPIQKVHKMKQKKREKLKKYLYNDASFQQNAQSKDKLQNGIRVSIDTTPDYRFNKIIDPQKKSFKDDVLKQLKNIRQTTDYNRKCEKDEDARLYK